VTSFNVTDYDLMTYENIPHSRKELKETEKTNKEETPLPEDKKYTNIMNNSLSNLIIHHENEEENI